MAIIVLTDNHMYSVPTQAGTTLILLIILGVTYVFMLAATPILRVIGKNGAAILVRVMGMILAALSVELVLGALGLEKWTAGAQGLLYTTPSCQRTYKGFSVRRQGQPLFIQIGRVNFSGDGKTILDRVQLKKRTWTNLINYF